MPSAPAPPLALLTGFPGFIGRRLVRQLLGQDPTLRVAALVEPRMLDAALTVAETIGDDRLEIVPGDITEARLGLADGVYERLAAEATLVFHLAAIYNLAVPLAVAQRVNVEGTANVLTFC